MGGDKKSVSKQMTTNSEQGIRKEGKGKRDATTSDDGTAPIEQLKQQENTNMDEEETESINRTGEEEEKTAKSLGPATLSCRQLRNDLDHLIDIDELHPSLQILCGVVPDKLGLLRPTKEGTRALVRLFDHRPAALHPELGFEHAKLPTL